MIALEGVTKRYGRHGEILALDDVCLTVDAGSFLLLTGASGAGKTTLLRLLYAAERPDTGRVLVFDRDVGRLRSSSIPYLRRNLGVVHQDLRLLPDRSALANVALALEIRSLPARGVRDRAAAVLVAVGLGAKLDARPHELSAGERQRVAIARAAVADPAILLADEPTGSLDPDSAHDLLALFSEIHRRGTTVVLATHEPILIAAGERAGLERAHLHAGRLELRRSRAGAGGEIVRLPTGRVAGGRA